MMRIEFRVFGRILLLGVLLCGFAQADPPGERWKHNLDQILTDYLRDHYDDHLVGKIIIEEEIDCSLNSETRCLLRAKLIEPIAYRSSGMDLNGMGVELVIDGLRNPRHKATFVGKTHLVFAIPIDIEEQNYRFLFARSNPLESDIEFLRQEYAVARATNSME